MTQSRLPAFFDSLDDAVASLLASIEGPLRVGAPLGIGKPHRFLNALYARIEADPSRSLTLYTALSLDPPSGSSALEKRFLAPFVARLYGDDFPRLTYVQAQKRDALPAHDFAELPRDAQPERRARRGDQHHKRLITRLTVGE